MNQSSKRHYFNAIPTLVSISLQLVGFKLRGLHVCPCLLLIYTSYMYTSSCQLVLMYYLYRNMVQVSVDRNEIVQIVQPKGHSCDTCYVDVVQSCVLSLSISVSPVVFPELSLTPHNLSTVLDSMDDGLWNYFGVYVNIPQFERERIRRQYSSDSERKQAVISSLISSHPALSWRLVANALYQLGLATVYHGGDGASCHRALDHLQKLFPTGIYMYIVFSILLLTCTCVHRFTLHIHEICNVHEKSLLVCSRASLIRTP